MLDKLRITVLCENMVGRIGSGEHGFAAFIETPSGNYLFDTGGGKFLAENAAAFGKDLRSVSKIFISHGHDDHAGGLALALRSLPGEVDIHAHPELFRERWLTTESGGEIRRTFKGVPFRREYLESLGGRFVFSRDFLAVAEGIYLSGEVPRLTSFESSDPRQQIKEGDEYATDPFIDDQSLVLTTSAGLVILFGCAHAGMINIIRHAIDKTGEKRLAALIGGTHLGFLGRERMAASIAELQGYAVQTVACSHCTGLEGAMLLRETFGERFRYGSVGYAYTLD
ncbi:MAG: MBL fold metallo-hydrolase [Desulfuromonadaceae bacterium]|nr:MBL fold metallo-hydrolase [Desulfuromonadaceae bacterium]